MSTTAAEETSSGGFLGWIERVGNKVPHPAIIFLALIVGVIVLSAVLAWADVSVTTEVAEAEETGVSQDYDAGGSSYPSLDHEPEQAIPEYDVRTETIEVESLLNGDGIRYMFTTAVQNFNDFGVVAVILVAMIGVGVAEEAGLIAALIRKMVQVAPAGAITFIIVLLGGISSVASDAGYLVLIPLGAAAFASLGRNPLVGIAAAYAGVSASFFVNILITPADGIITEVTNEIVAGVAPGAEPLNVTNNFYFAIVSTLFTAAVMTILTERYIEPRAGRWDPAERPADAPVDHVPAGDELAHESRGLRLSGIYTLVAVAIICALTFIPGAPLRNPETGEIFGNSPFMSSLLLIISMLFLAAGLGYGRGSGSLTGSTNVINAIVKTFNGLGGLIFLMLLIAQFIAFFNYSNISNVVATQLADLLGSADIGALPLLIGFILLVVVIDMIMPGVIPKWAIIAPIFIPLFYNLGIAPQTVLAAYRVGDGPVNVITPLMVYLPFIILVCQRYRASAGMGTVISMMLPYTVVVLVSWTLLFTGWYLLEIPWGPGSPVQLE
ncbi:AbgT family transporter [Nocardioides sp. S-58]|uniref:AbgT family transporter n=1 Tax=Nocardioides renjunii TaxID=3095075 RepID=A0ABU5KAQ6_9ACTN|nr:MULTISPECIES: AbgT family transporter [unclassified Nocardioides]MDZ5662043.1 AbgT family transporter [Nocardioides sp. S-58]WQQ24282.1 AbgT family transporter [Nocardioides sp. S-34]